MPDHGGSTDPGAVRWDVHRTPRSAVRGALAYWRSDGAIAGTAIMRRREVRSLAVHTAWSRGFWRSTGAVPSIQWRFDGQSGPAMGDLDTKTPGRGVTTRRSLITC
jgi:hypothetical protein